MEALMKCSHLARAAATTTGLLPQLIEDLDEIHGSLGSNSSDFIRRHGNAKVGLPPHAVSCPNQCYPLKPFVYISA